MRPVGVTLSLCWLLYVVVVLHQDYPREPEREGIPEVLQ